MTLESWIPVFYKRAKVGIFSFCFFIFFGLQQVFNWPFLGSLHVSSNAGFIDLGPTINALECYRVVGLEVYGLGDTSPCFYLYGSSLLKALAPTGLTTSLTNVLGWTFIGLVSFIFGFIFSLIVSNSKARNLFCILLLLSPATMLLLERGNIDIIILFLLCLAGLAFTYKFKFSAMLLILITSLIKFYTLPLALIFCVLIPNSKRKLFGLLLVSYGFFQVTNDIKLLVDLPRYVNSSFGNPVPAMYLAEIGINLSRVSEHLIGVLLLVVAVIVIIKLQYSLGIFKLAPFPSIEQWTISNVLQMIFMITFLSCYFAGVSFDFRLIFLTLTCLLEISRTHKAINFFPLVMGLDLITNWTLNTRYLEPIGDLCLLMITAYFLILLHPQVKNLVKNIGMSTFVRVMRMSGRQLNK